MKENIFYIHEGISATLNVYIEWFSFNTMLKLTQPCGGCSSAWLSLFVS